MGTKSLTKIFSNNELKLSRFDSHDGYIENGLGMHLICLLRDLKKYNLINNFKELLNKSELMDKENNLYYNMSTAEVIEEALAKNEPIKEYCFKNDNNELKVNYIYTIDFDKELFTISIENKNCENLIYEFYNLPNEYRLKKDIEKLFNKTIECYEEGKENINIYEISYTEKDKNTSIIKYISLNEGSDLDIKISKMILKHFKYKEKYTMDKDLMKLLNLDNNYNQETFSIYHIELVYDINKFLIKSKKLEEKTLINNIQDFGENLKLYESLNYSCLKGIEVVEQTILIDVDNYNMQQKIKRYAIYETIYEIQLAKNCPKGYIIQKTYNKENIKFFNSKDKLSVFLKKKNDYLYNRIYDEI